MRPLVVRRRRFERRSPEEVESALFDASEKPEPQIQRQPLQLLGGDLVRAETQIEIKKIGSYPAGRSSSPREKVQSDAATHRQAVCIQSMHWSQYPCPWMYGARIRSIR